jgi:hypothetical protein
MKYLRNLANAFLAAAIFTACNNGPLSPSAPLTSAFDTTTINGSAAPPRGTLYVGMKKRIDVFEPPYRQIYESIVGGMGNFQLPLSGWTGLSVSPTGVLFVGTPHALRVYDPPYTDIPITIPGTPDNVIQSSTGTMFEVVGKAVRIFQPPYSIETASTLRYAQTPQIAVDRQGRLIVFLTTFASSAGKTSIDVYAPPYLTAPTSASHPFPLARAYLDSQDHLFLGFILRPTTSSSPFAKVEEYSAPYTGSAVVTITKGLTSTGDGGRWVPVADDAMGNLLVLSSGGLVSPGTLLKYAPPYAAAPRTIPTAWANHIAFGPRNELFIANCGLVCSIGENQADRLVVVVPPFTGKQRTLVKGVWSFSLSLSGDLFAYSSHRVLLLPPPYSSTPITVLKSRSSIAALATLP